MRVLMVVPDALARSGGNRVTTARLAKNLELLGVEVQIQPVSEAANLDGWDLVHAFHLYRSGAAIVRRCRLAGIPLVVTWTGTDLSYDLFNPLRRSDILQVLQYASFHIVFHEPAAVELSTSLPQYKERLRVILPGVELPPSLGLTKEHWGWNQNESIWLLPAGLRKVKDPLFALPPLTRLHDKDSRLRLVHLGAPIDGDLAKRVREAARRMDWVKYLGEVAYEKMGDLYALADVVLNTSEAEGLSNAVMEAMLAGRPVLARCNTGNAAAIRHEKDGLLFRDESDFERLALRLLEDPVWRAELGAAAKETATTRFHPSREAKLHVDLYHEARRGR